MELAGKGFTITQLAAYAGGTLRVYSSVAGADQRLYVWLNAAREVREYAAKMAAGEGTLMGVAFANRKWDVVTGMRTAWPGIAAPKGKVLAILADRCVISLGAKDGVRKGDAIRSP